MQLIKLSTKILMNLMALIALCIVCVLAAIQFTDFNKHKAVIEQHINGLTGYRMKIRGDITARVFPSFGVYLDDIVFDLNQDKVDFVVNAKSFHFGINFFKLLTRKIELKNLTFIDLQVRNKKSSEPEFHIIKLQTQFLPMRDSVTFSQLNFELDSGEYSGHLKFVFYGKYNEVTGEIKADTLTFDKKESGTLPVSANALRELKGNIQFSADKINVGHISIQDAIFTIVPDQNKLSVDLKSKINQGQLIAQYILDDVTQVTGYKHIELNLSDVNAAQFLKQFDPTLPIAKGLLDLQFKVMTNGGTEKTFYEAMKGQTALSINNMQLLEGGVHTATLMDALFSSLAAKKQDELRCLVAKFDIAQGRAVAHQTIGLETKELIGMGNGEINLATKNIDFLVKLQPSSSSALELGRLEGLIKATGTWSSPKVDISADLLKGALTNTGSVLLGISTGGLSLLANSLVDGLIEEASPCKNIKQTN